MPWSRPFNSTAAATSAYRMSIPHDSCDTLLGSQLLEQDTALLTAHPRGDQSVSPEALVRKEMNIGSGGPRHQFMMIKIRPLGSYLTSRFSGRLLLPDPLHRGCHDRKVVVHRYPQVEYCPTSTTHLRLRSRRSHDGLSQMWRCQPRAGHKMR